MQIDLNRRILVVDNAQSPLDSLVQLLIQNEFEIFRAHSTSDALEIFNREAILIVIAETDLSGMDGFELLREIKATNGIVQVIMVSDHMYVQNLFRALDGGADDFLLKPLSPETIRPVLTATVHKLIRWQGVMKQIYELQEETANVD